MPGCAIAAFRMNRPTVIIYGGTIQAGVRHVDCPALGFKKGDPVNIGEAFESYGMSSTGPYTLPNIILSSLNAGAYATGKISDEERLDVIRHACPGSGACGGMFTCVDSHNAFTNAFLTPTPQGQHDGNCPRSFGIGPSVLFWNPRHLPWSVGLCSPGDTRAHASAEKAQECFKAPKYLKNLMELDLKPKCV